VGKKNWADTDDAVAMYAHLDRHTRGLPDRKFRLLYAAVIQAKWGSLLTPAGRRVLAAVENVADGRSHPVGGKVQVALFDPNAPASAEKCLTTALGDEAWLLRRPAVDGFLGRRDPVASALLRDVFGRPFGRGPFHPAWRTADAIGLARAIYDDRAFDRLPILADALLDAGCDDDDILNHCRGAGPHVRGCWVVDLVLDKE
jgi:hypothetical protein